MQEYTDDTAELWRQLDALGGMAGLQEPEKQLLALPELEQYVSAVRHAGLTLPAMTFCHCLSQAHAVRYMRLVITAELPSLAPSALVAMYSG